MATFAGSGSTTFIVALQSIVLLPLYLKSVGTEAFGIWLATGEILLWMVAFDCGIPNLMIQRIGSAHAKGDNRDIAKHFASCVAMLTMTALLLSGLVWALAPTVVYAFSLGRSVPLEVVDALRLAAIATGLVLLNYSFQGLARALQQTLWMNLVAVIATLAGFAATYVLLLQGYGLQAIALGLVIRSGGSIVGNLVLFLFSDSFKIARQGFRPTWEIMREYLRETPLLLTSGLAYAFMNNSQIAIANLVLGPAAAVLLSIARRIADFVKAILDMVSYATEGGLAHLYASESKEKISRVLTEIDERFFAIAVVMLAGLVAVNGPFVTLWTSGEFHVEHALTVLIALRTVLTTWSYMGVARLRAAGQFRAASALLLGDCASRVALMFAGAAWFGLIGLSIGAVAPGILFGQWARVKLTKVMGVSPKFDPTLAYLCAGLFAIAVVIGLLVKPTGFIAIVALGAAVSGISGLILFVASRRAKPRAEAVALGRAA